ncbi:hypothetical protein BGZ83_002158 [Gryganskiella cystojenkinii]|nr:hypothetical protein BGZ83_002158 [Gryganskiella cystojenkinii]
MKSELAKFLTLRINPPAKLESLTDKGVQADPGRPWVCLGLKRLWIGIDWTGTSVETLVSPKYEGIFKRLGMLRDLRSLTVASYDQHQSFGAPWEMFGFGDYDQHPKFGLSLRLSLVDLGHLEKLDLTDTRQEFSGDVKWMMGHWPALKYVVGTLYASPEVNVLLRRILEDRGVRKNVARLLTILIS